MYECLNHAKVTYFANEKQTPFFFTNDLTDVVKSLSEALDKETHIQVFPDAMVKPNGLPTGTIISSSPGNAILFPLLLRDPGCGYLTFKLKFTEKVNSDWYQTAGRLLDELVNKKLPPHQPNHQSLNISEIIERGIEAMNVEPSDLDRFADRQFPVDPTVVKPTQKETDILVQSFKELTNTVEIRTIIEAKGNQSLAKYNLGNEDFIGFIHSGSDIFPQLLAERFVYRILEYADQNHLFPVDKMKKGIFGIPLNTPLGGEYAEWLYAAMNYAVTGRYSLYLDIKQQLEAQFPCQLTLLNDNTHAGLFKKNINGKTIVKSSRGVQQMSSNSLNNPYGDLNLLAGQRETIAALVIPGKQAQGFDNLLAHGTSYHIQTNYDYAQNFTEKDINKYQNFAEGAFYNSQPKYEECLPYTYNLLASLEYMEQIGLARTVALLAPMVNIRSKKLNIR